MVINMNRFIDDKIIVTKCYFGIFSFHPNEGWMELTFLGKFDSEGAADRALFEYVKQPENKSASEERYQIRAVITTYHALAEFDWKPNNDSLYVSNLKENLK